MSAPHTIKCRCRCIAAARKWTPESAAARSRTRAPPRRWLGAATYVDDIAEVRGTLHAAPILSPVAHGRLRAWILRRAGDARACVGVVLAQDIPATRSWPPLPTMSPSSPSTRWNTSAGSSAWSWPTP
jgi:xanthine dehydrogenase molybdopterin-binding subunit B